VRVFLALQHPLDVPHVLHDPLLYSSTLFFFFKSIL
jgi:hypothetical protein